MLKKLVRKKLKKSLEKILCWYKKSYMSVQKVPPGGRLKKFEKSSKVKELWKEFEKKIEKEEKFGKMLEK